MLNRINLIRAISCSLIVVFHTLEFLNANASGLHIPFVLAAPGFHLFLRLGGGGLELSTRPGDAPAGFRIRRLARLAPLYWIMTLVAIGLALWRPWTMPSADLSLESIAKSFLFLPHADASARLMPVLFVGWTLNYLVIFYLLFALSLFAPRKFQAPLVIGALLAVIAIGSLAPDNAAARFYSRPILLEFAAGVLIGHFLQSSRAAAWAKSQLLLPLLIVGVIGMFATRLAHLPDLLNTLAYCATGAVVVFALASQDLHGAPLKGVLPAHAGAISYAVLLVHPLLIPLIGAPLTALLPNEALRAAAMIPAVLLATFVAAHIAHKLVEKPINTALRAILKPNAMRLSPGLGASQPQAR
jgi:exopolysaccharide production protein ExoZ